MGYLLRGVGRGRREAQSERREAGDLPAGLVSAVHAGDAPARRSEYDGEQLVSEVVTCTDCLLEVPQSKV
jgi:hypothetical protein